MKIGKKYWKKIERKPYRKSYKKKYNQQYYIDNLKAIKKQQHGYYLKNREDKIEKAMTWNKEHREKHLKSTRKCMKRYRILHPKKRKAHEHTKKHKRIGNKCRNCGSTRNLRFHHTNYVTLEGYTLCQKCQGKAHRTNSMRPQLGVTA